MDNDTPRKSSAGIWWTIIIIVVIIIGSIIYMDNKSGTSPSTSTPQATQSAGAPMIPAGSSVLGISSSATLGSYLISYNGDTLYSYDKDTSGVSNCNGACATAWPPYTLPAGTSVAAGAGMTGNVSTIIRSDGTEQVTYNGMPLYYFASDSAAGQATGQNVGGFSVVKP